LRKLTPGILASALEELSADTSYQLGAAELSDKLHHEDGTNLAADIVEETIETYPGNYYDADQLMGAAS
jgi:UDP:flavonoid glycosyltransferase YjiC (YdhE family)